MSASSSPQPPARQDKNAIYTARQVQAILNYGRLEGAPSSVEQIVADLKDAGKWPTR